MAENYYDNGLARISAAVPEILGKGIRAGAERVRDRAKSACPVRTGALRNSISVSSDGMRAEVSANTNYAAFVEFGTSKMRAQPYLTPALIGGAEEIVNAVLQALEV